MSNADLIRQLRAVAEILSDGHPDNDRDARTVLRAADAMEAAEAEVARLRAALGRLRRGIAVMDDDERAAAGLDPNGGFDGPTGAD